jgi:hypothetical protein
MLGAEDPGLVALTIAYRDVREAFAARGMVKGTVRQNELETGRVVS